MAGSMKVVCEWLLFAEMLFTAEFTIAQTGLEFQVAQSRSSGADGQTRVCLMAQVTHSPSLSQYA